MKLSSAIRLNIMYHLLIMTSLFKFQTLDLLGSLCEQIGYKFLRLDGSTPSGQRMEIVNRFNNSYCDCSKYPV